MPKRTWKPRSLLDPSEDDDAVQSKKGQRKKIPNKRHNLPKDVEEAMCRECCTPGDESNDVLFCDECNIPMCQKCAGITEVPERDWYCAACAASRAAKSARGGFGHPTWQSFSRRVTGHAHKILRHRHMLDTYEVQASKSASAARMLPFQELQRARQGEYTGKHDIRSVLKELTEANPGNTRWAALMTPEEFQACEAAKARNIKLAAAATAAAAASSASASSLRPSSSSSESGCGCDAGTVSSAADALVDVEEVGCSICRVLESTDDNDILLCDRTGCFRAYHMRCFDPPITPEELDKARTDFKALQEQTSQGSEEEECPWYCPQCDCLQECFETLRDVLGHGSSSQPTHDGGGDNDGDDDDDGSGGGSGGGGVKTDWRDVFPEAELPPSEWAATESSAPWASLGGRGGAGNESAGEGGVDDDEDEEEDSDFDPGCVEEFEVELLASAVQAAKERGEEVDGRYEDEDSDGDDDGDSSGDGDDGDDDDDDDDEEGEGDGDLDSVCASEIDDLSDAAVLVDSEDGGDSDGDSGGDDEDGKGKGEGVRKAAANNESGTLSVHKKRRNLRSCHSATSSSSSSSSSSGGRTASANDGTLDLGNIVHSKRQRTKVDYVALNGELFAGVCDTDAATLDDVEVWRPGSRDDSSSEPFSPADSTVERAASGGGFEGGGGNGEDDPHDEDDLDLQEALRISRLEASTGSSKKSLSSSRRTKKK